MTTLRELYDRIDGMDYGENTLTKAKTYFKKTVDIMHLTMDCDICTIYENFEDIIQELKNLRKKKSYAADCCKYCRMLLLHGLTSEEKEELTKTTLDKWYDYIRFFKTDYYDSLKVKEPMHFYIKEDKEVVESEVSDDCDEVESVTSNVTFDSTTTTGTQTEVDDSDTYLVSQLKVKEQKIVDLVKGNETSLNSVIATLTLMESDTDLDPEERDTLIELLTKKRDLLIAKVIDSGEKLKMLRGTIDLIKAGL